MRVISSFCSALIMRFAIQREGSHRGNVVEREQHCLTMRAVPVTAPRRHAENVLLLPFELLVADFGPARARRDLIDGASRMADGFCCLLDELEAGAHGGHHRSIG